jgi:hypothetical protein
MSVAVNQKLADRATQIARAQRIDFGEALRQARCEMADIVQHEMTLDRSKKDALLSDQQKSTTPDPSKVREAVDGGLRAVGWKTSSTGGVDAYSVFLGVFEVGFRLSELGLGPNIVSSLKMELSNFLNYAFQTGTPSSVIPQAADHTAAVYTHALANKIGTQTWSDGIARPVQGVALAERAEKLTKQRNISFGEALNIARREITMAADASLTSDQIEQAIAGDVKNAVISVFNGKPKIIFESGDALKIMEAVKAAITRLDIGSLGIDPIKAAEITVNTFIGASVTNTPDAISAKIVAAIQKAYNTAASGT